MYEVTPDMIDWPTLSDEAKAMLCGILMAVITSPQMKRQSAGNSALVRPSMTRRRRTRRQMTFETKDSGQRRDFSTGSRRDDRKGKGRYDLIPPMAVKRLAQLYERGAEKYEDNNWRQGQNLSSTADSMLRHAYDYLSGDRSEDHIGAVIWNAIALMWTEDAIERGFLPPELSDLPDRPITPKK